MAKITIFAAGSQGDIQPCVALGIGLKKAGYQVVIAAPEDFAGFIQSNQLRFFPLKGDVQKIMASDTGRQFMESGGSNPIRSIRAMRRLIAPVIMTMVNDAYEACQGADAIICLGVFSPFGHSIAESLKYSDYSILNRLLYFQLRHFLPRHGRYKEILAACIIIFLVWQCLLLFGCGISHL